MIDLLGQFHTHMMDPDRLPKAGAALLLTAVGGYIIGPLFSSANPLIWLGLDKIFGSFGDRLDRLRRPQTDLMFRGFLLTAVVIFLVIILGNFLEKLILSKPYYGFTEIFALSFLITSGTVWAAILRLFRALEGKKRTEGAYLAISRSTRTNLSIADDFTITRVAAGFAARSFDKGLVAPVFWYLLGGLPLALIYAAVAWLTWRFGKDGFSKGFGLVPQGLEKLMGCIPGLFAGLLIALSGAFTPTAGLTRGFLSFFGAKNRATYQQGGYPLSALAWSLNISLGGATQDLSGSAIKGAWVGPEKATAQNDYRHLRRALYISVTAHILLFVCLCGAYLSLSAP